MQMHFGTSCRQTNVQRSPTRRLHKFLFYLCLVLSLCPLRPSVQCILLVGLSVDAHTLSSNNAFPSQRDIRR